MARIALQGAASTQQRPRLASVSPGLEGWAGAPFSVVAGGPDRARVLWPFAHGMAIFEIHQSLTSRAMRLGHTRFGDPASCPKEKTIGPFEVAQWPMILCWLERLILMVGSRQGIAIGVKGEHSNEPRVPRLT